ncbi:ABC transporter ATP-binding protein [Microbacterium sp. STN6]|uniref:ABC transporter ATP-binding protein n=1 Tax=Microbacterium sp. STN6 TaxID=2995588 RepID=UPI002260A938|nr:ABC transporter ATP-binding protein [Microbacterium sp. STN6]MCX7522318.1 ABC transporter ATP-binding protein [Microbacterium sp. STN6]
MTAYGDEALIVCDSLVRIYQVEKIEVQALQGLDLLVDRGEMVAIVGASGSGKSTLLNILSGLDAPTAGRVRVGEWDLLDMSAKQRLAYRRSMVGFIWQQTARNLLPYLSVAENVALPMSYARMPRADRRRRVGDLLEVLGMGGKAHRRPKELSGGEQQRAAIAVALANDPQVLFADEPTGELDSQTGGAVFDALRSANTELGTTVVIVTHDAEVSSQVQRTVAIRDGRTASEVLRHEEVDEWGDASVIAREYAVLDRAGRLQLPAGYRSALGLRGRVRLELEEDHVGVWPGEAREAVSDER